jgi:hypothetical protein
LRGALSGDSRACLARGGKIGITLTFLTRAAFGGAWRGRKEGEGMIAKISGTFCKLVE